MKQFIEGTFTLLAVLFDKIPFMKKLEGYRTVVGLIGLGVVFLLKKVGILTDTNLFETLQIGLTGWTALSLNSKGRSEGE